MSRPTYRRAVLFSLSALLLLIVASAAAREVTLRVGQVGLRPTLTPVRPAAVATAVIVADPPAARPPAASSPPPARSTETPATPAGAEVVPRTRPAPGITVAMATQAPAPEAPPTPLIPPDGPPAPPSPPDGPPLAALAELVAGPLDGLPTPRGAALRRPLAIMVENYAPDARPQTGLLPASVVFETIAEFGVTRFMAVYQEHDAPLVGPVRSARVYYDHWAEGLRAIFVHAGGNSDAVAELWTLPNLTNIDEIATQRSLDDTGAPFFARSSARSAPHNLYTYPALLRAEAAAQGQWTVGEPPWQLAHKAEAPLAQRPAGGAMDIAFSGPAYAVHYDYDRATNTYPRSMAGQAHLDAVSGARIAPKNVVLLIAGVTPDSSSDTLGSVVVQSEGVGTAYYFSDGTVRQGLWRKDGVDEPLQLLDRAGNPAPLNPGQTWIEVAPQGNAVSWDARQAP